MSEKQKIHMDMCADCRALVWFKFEIQKCIKSMSRNKSDQERECCSGSIKYTTS